MQETIYRSCTAKKLQFTPYDIECIRQAIGYIYKHYMEKISAEHLSLEVGLSKDKLQAGFRMLTSNTIHKYIQQTRIRKAKELLVNTNKPLKLVADAAGFVNESHFCKVFKKILLTSPAQYRYQQAG